MRNIELKELIRMHSESAEHGEKRILVLPKKTKRKTVGQTGGNAKRGSLININADFSTVTLVGY